MPRFHILSILTVATALLGPPAAAEGPPTARQRLATQLARTSILLMDDVQWVTMDIMRMAVELAEQAAMTDPDDPEVWRILADMAQLAEEDELYVRALEGLSRVDPADDTARLGRLNAALDRHQTAGERIAATKEILANGPDRLGRPVASRLLMDMALLERRIGDIDAFAEHLSEAIEVDPSNRAAAALAAGFFRLYVDDSMGDAELLTTLMLADPTDVATQVALAQGLLNAGAYTGAARVYDLAVRNHVRARTDAAAELLADQALALWASGDVGGALRTIRQRQHEEDDKLRAAIRKDTPEMDPLERSRRYAPIRPTLATVRAAIHQEIGHEDAADSFTRAMQAYGVAIDIARRKELPDELARLGLEFAWVSLWIGGDVEEARTFLEAVQTVKPLTTEAMKRFDGWMALCGDEPETAREFLEPLVEVDPMARLGIAELDRRAGRTKNAARDFLVIAREQPGSLLGIWASNRVASIIGQRVPLSETASGLEELVRSIPPVFFEYPRASSLAVNMNVDFEKPVFESGEPIILNIEITNNSPYPLAIDRDGPIRPHVILFLTTTLQRPGSKAREVPPMVVDIGRRLRIESRETIVIPVDLRRYHLGRALARDPISGVFVKVRAMVNAHGTTQGAIVPALLGAEQSTPTIRIEGIPLTADWMTGAFANARALDPDDPAALEDLAMLARVVALGLPESAPPQQRQLYVEVAKLLNERYTDMDEATQAWLLGTVPAGRLSPQILAMARKSESELVQLSYLLYQLAGIDDPMLDAARRSPNDSVRIVAEQYANTFERLTEALGGRQRQLEEQRLQDQGLNQGRPDSGDGP